MMGQMFASDFLCIYFLPPPIRALVAPAARAQSHFYRRNFAAVVKSDRPGFDRKVYQQFVIGAERVCFSAVGTIVATLVGTVIWGFGSVSLSGVFSLAMSLIAQLAVILAISSVFACVSVLFRTTGAAVAVCIISTMSLSIVFTVIDLIAKWNFSLAKFELSTMLSSVSALSPASGDIIRAAIASAVYLAISCAVGIVVFRKRDI
jgi:hypothetical protein